MAEPTSALDHEPHELIREVSPEAISFYVDELSGIYLPDDFRQEHDDRTDVKYWKPEDRLLGKFGRFTLRHVQGEGEDEPLDGILLMGTTIGLSGLDRYGDLRSLRHYSFIDTMRDVLEARGLMGQNVAIDRADYGATNIALDGSDIPIRLDVFGSSGDYGRADTEGRRQTCEMFEHLIGPAITVINRDPEPRPRERIVD
jgi:hypothetical protein